MAKTATLQLRLDPADMNGLRVGSELARMPLSDFVRHQLEPAIVAGKIAHIAQDFTFITRIILFGSMARREQESASDIDLAIETSGRYRWMGERGMGRFVHLVEEACGRNVDVVKAKYCNPQLAAEIAQDGEVVYEKQASPRT